MNLTHLLLGALGGYAAAYVVNQSTTLATSFPSVYNYSNYILAGAGVAGGIMSHGRGLGGYGYGFAAGAIVQAAMAGTLNPNNVGS